jgi:hypothetical protein
MTIAPVDDLPATGTECHHPRMSPNSALYRAPEFVSHTTGKICHLFLAHAT